ncbi:hypothetical protein SP90_02995 [Halodesulfovibrio spirochaetisodalis]|uniref:Uncharacterized protein n=1 Tax=Halodesulfovibrio spirochaetisodalis TaxID=1560234 RepID=A0A1B7XLA5_9BACT|nr:hypothetical protein SP90_02995 [Halodesulfovibrio spirochaetisodalis]
MMLRTQRRHFEKKPLTDGYLFVPPDLFSFPALHRVAAIWQVRTLSAVCGNFCLSVFLLS